MTMAPPAPTLTPEQLAQALEILKASGALDQLKADLSSELSEEMARSGRFTGESMDIEEGGLGSGGFPWHYWKRNDGRVITGPEPRETLHVIYKRKGYVELAQYGNLPSPGAPVPCCRHLQQKDHQFHVLMANGGAKELSIDQIINAGWHEKPPVVHGRTIRFPQLEDVVIETVECPECDKPIYGVEGTNQIIVRMRQHARSAHGWTRKETSEALVEAGYLDAMPTTVRRTLSRKTQAAINKAPVDDDEEDDEAQRAFVAAHSQQAQQPASQESEPEAAQPPAARVTKGATGKS